MSFRQRIKQYQFYKVISDSNLWSKCLRAYDYRKKYWRCKSFYGKSKLYYFVRIARWMHINRFPQDNVVEIIRSLKTSVYNRKVDDRQIAFWVGHISPRVIKMARALVANGFTIETFVPDNIEAVGLLKNLEEISNCKRFQSVEELMFYLMNSNAFVIHCFTEWSFCAEVNVLLHQPQLFPPVVVERYDVITGMYTKELSLCYKNILKEEKYAMENAAGVCFRNFTREYLEREFNFSYKGVCITFLDYYDQEMEVMSDVDINNIENLSICYAGQVTTEKKSPGSRVACHLDFAELCRKHKVHYHIYPRIWDEEAYSDYIELEQHNSYFHLHHPIAYENLGKELKKYDYGVVPSRKEDYSVNAYTKEQWIYGTSNKVFDYLCFGLPIVQNDQMVMVEELAAKDMLIPWDIEQFDFDILRQRKGEMKEKVFKNRNYYRIDNRIHELIAFYRQL